ncbi:MAG TPA: tetratricopeptide repeat protein, partial [Planctomycetaceae bacterium]|nr:tetratricopeptide repeat protein [Planctomycetaceae bacterium]
MRANLLAARGRWFQAASQSDRTDLDGVRTEIAADLQKWSQLYEKDEVYWAEAAGVYLALGDTDKAEQAARKARELAPDNVNVIGLQAAIFERQGEPDRARQVILDALKSVPEESVPRLRAMLAQLERNRKDETSGDAVADAATDPSRLTIPRLLELAEQDLARRNRRALKWLEAIRKQEGDQGTTWKYIRGRWLMIDLADKPPKNRSDARLGELESIVRELRRERSAWAPTYVLAGMLAQATNDVRGAIEAYRQAIELGERRVFVFEQLAKLMWTAGEEGVDDVLARLGTRVPSDPELSAISILTAAREDDLQAAVDRAALAVKQRPNDPMAYLWYAQMLYLQKRPAAAEQQLLKATQVAPKEIRPWVTLVGFYVREGRTEEARAAAEKLEQTAQFNDDAQKNFIMAQIERQLGDTEKAAERYSAAIQLAGDDETRAAVLVKAAQVDLENDEASAAIAKLERAAKLVPASGQIRRLLAAALAARGKGDDYDRALDLLQQTDLSAGDQLSDRRLRGLLLARRSDIAYRSNVAEAQKVYEELVAEKENPADRAFLASLCMVRACLEPPEGQSREEVDQLRQELIERADAEYR